MYDKGFPLPVCKWVKSFVTERRALIRLDDYISEPDWIHVGVPQGSPVSPTLACIYASELLERMIANPLRTLTPYTTHNTKQLPVDQLPISAVLGSAPIPYRVYLAPTFGIPDRCAIGRPVHISRLPGSPDYFSILPAVYPTSCRPSTATWLNDPRLSSSGSRSTVYWLLSLFDLILQRLWRQPIIATRDFLFRIDRFP